MTKKHLAMEHVRLAMANDVCMDTPVRTIAVCAGSGGSVLAGVKADLIITGEMSHHEVLDFVHKGVSVILAGHSNTERGYFKVAKEKLEKLLGSDVKILVSQVDKDPLQIV
jgi:putative NIF3 family GTP cyclohydrolase 1 type 2